MKFQHLVLSIALLGSSSLFAAGQAYADDKSDSKIDAKKAESVRELFKLQKTDRIAEQVMAQMLEMMSPQVPQDKQKKLEETIKKELNAKELTEQLVPVYAQNFTQGEIDEVIAFYKTATGQKFITNQPKLIGDSSAVIQTWATKVSNKVKDKMGLNKKK